MIRPGIWRRELAVPLQSIQAELNRLFEEIWQPPADPAPASATHSPQVAPRPGGGAATAAAEAGAGAVWTPAIDLWETPGELVLLVDLPGVDPATVDLSLTGNILAVRGERAAREERAPEAGKGRVRERPAGSFYRQVTLVDDVDFDRVEAQAKDGVLSVRLPKRDSAQARTIPIRPATS